MGIFSIVFLETHKASFQSFTKSKETDTEQKVFFTKEEFLKINWIEEDEEFEWRGKLFDVSKIEQRGNGFLIHCENDQWEEEFISLFSSWKDQKHPDGKLKFFFQPMCLAEKFLLHFPPTSTKLNCNEATRLGSDIHSQLISPPPDHLITLS